MQARQMQEHHATFERERELRRQRIRREAGPALALMPGGQTAPAPLPDARPRTAEETADEAAALIADYFACDEEGRRIIADTARRLAG